MKQLPLQDSTIIDWEIAYSAESRPEDYGAENYNNKPPLFIRNS